MFKTAEQRGQMMKLCHHYINESCNCLTFVFLAVFMFLDLSVFLGLSLFEANYILNNAKVTK